MDNQERWLAWSDVFPAVEGWYWGRRIDLEGYSAQIIYCWPKEQKIALYATESRISPTDWRWPLFRIRTGRLEFTQSGTHSTRIVTVNDEVLDDRLSAKARIVPCTKPYYEFMRMLRTDPKTQHGFMEHGAITSEQQEAYMESNAHKHIVCLYGDLPVGYAGVIDNDIRFCVIPYYHGRGFGTFMLEWIKKHYPDATGRIKASNAGSRGAFHKVGIPYTLMDG